MANLGVTIPEQLLTWARGEVLRRQEQEGWRGDIGDLVAEALEAVMAIQARRLAAPNDPHGGYRGGGQSLWPPRPGRRRLWGPSGG